MCVWLVVVPLVWRVASSSSKPEDDGVDVILDAAEDEADDEVDVDVLVDDGDGVVVVVVGAGEVELNPSVRAMDDDVDVVEVRDVIGVDVVDEAEGDDVDGVMALTTSV